MPSQRVRLTLIAGLRKLERLLRGLTEHLVLSKSTW
jgi:hypothetical protein